MLKIKQSRISIILECYLCRLKINKEKIGVSRYLTSKNKKNNSNKLELSKYCKFCNKHTIHKEIK